MSFRHFFGQSCIERWLRGASSCPNCNEKAAKKDVRLCHLETPFSNYKEFNCYAICFSQVRPHYVARLAALDTGERDRALAGEHLFLYQLFFHIALQVVVMSAALTKYLRRAGEDEN